MKPALFQILFHEINATFKTMFLIVKRFKIYACYSSMSNCIVSVRPFMGWQFSTVMNGGCKIHPGCIHNNNIKMLMFLEQTSDSPSSSTMYKLQ